MKKQKFLTVREFASGVREFFPTARDKWIYTLIYNKKIKARKLGGKVLIRYEELKKFLRTGE